MNTELQAFLVKNGVNEKHLISGKSSILCNKGILKENRASKGHLISRKELKRGNKAFLMDQAASKRYVISRKDLVTKLLYRKWAFN